jgi:hypothetical protein
VTVLTHVARNKTRRIRRSGQHLGQRCVDDARVFGPRSWIGRQELLDHRNEFRGRSAKRIVNGEPDVPGMGVEHLLDAATPDRERPGGEKEEDDAEAV